MVPGSTLRYGSSFRIVTRSPRALSRRPRLEAVRPLPRLEATPPVTKRCLVNAGREEKGAAAKGRLPWSVRSGNPAGPRAIRISASGYARRRHTGTGGGQRVINVVSGSRSGVGAGIGLRRLPHPALRGGEPLLVGLPEPGQRHGANHREAEPEHRHPAHTGPGVIAQVHDP